MATVGVKGLSASLVSAAAIDCDLQIYCFVVAVNARLPNGQSCPVHIYLPHQWSCLTLSFIALAGASLDL